MRYLLIPLILIACGKKIDLKKEEARYDAYVEALPELKPVAQDSAINLKVHYLSEPRFASLTGDERQKLYAQVSDLCARVYGLKLSITEFGQTALRDYFAAADDRFHTSPIAFPSQAFQISFFAPDRQQRIIDAIRPKFKKHGLEKIREYLGDVATPADVEKVFTQRLSRIYAEKDLHGKALLEETNKRDEIYFSFGHWSSLAQGEKEADFIVTNGGIIGADNGMPLYVLARGGVTNAFVENNAHRPYQAVGILGMYPFLADTAYFNERRGKLSTEEKIEAIAWLWLHELGHMLLKKDENYTFADSVHRAPPDLKYMDWVKAIRNTKNHHTREIGNMKKF